MTDIGPFTLRKATQKDAADLAIIDNMSSAGLSFEFWLHAVRKGEAENPLVFARQRFADSGSIFGWRNAIVAENETGVLGAITAYEMTEPDDETDEMKRVFPGFVPVFELFEEAVHEWFIDSLGVFPEARNLGIAGRLLDAAMAEGRNRGYRVSSLVVESDNRPAIRIYENKGYVRTSSLPRTGADAEGDWWLMKAGL